MPLLARLTRAVSLKCDPVVKPGLPGISQARDIPGRQAEEQRAREDHLSKARWRHQPPQAEEQRAREDHLTKERLRHPSGRGSVLLRSIGGLLRVGLLGRVGAVNVHCVHDAVQVVLSEFTHPARQLDLYLVTGPTKWQHSTQGRCGE